METIVEVECDTDIVSYINLWTAIADGSSYPALAAPGVFSLACGTVSSEDTFPDLIVTLLTPGEPITIVLLNIFFSLDSSINLSNYSKVTHM